MHFPVAGVELHPLMPVAVAFGISAFTSLGGVSGAFLLMPFQVSVLGFAGPAASATNHLYNLVATPGGVWRYARESRIVWPLVAVIVAGAIPGVLGGAWLRVHYLHDPARFRLFLALVLLYLGVRLALDALRGKRSRPAAMLEGVVVRERSRRHIAYEFAGTRYVVRTVEAAALSAGVGIVGGIYGIGGGALIAPFLVSVFRLPVHTVAGAALAATFATSAAAVGAYLLVGSAAGGAIPDWRLGLLFGLGGLAGTYVGARAQRFVPARPIQWLLAACTLGPAVGYLWAASGMLTVR
jgi:hypothetical protein